MSPDRSRRTRPARGKSLIAERPPRSPARIIYVVAEGEATEPDYCTALNDHFGDVHQFYINTRYSRRNGLHPLEVAEEAVTIASDPRELSGPQDGSSADVHQKLRSHPAFERFAAATAGSKAITADRAKQLLVPGRIESAVRNARALVRH